MNKGRCHCELPLYKNPMAATVTRYSYTKQKTSLLIHVDEQWQRGCTQWKKREPRFGFFSKTGHVEKFYNCYQSNSISSIATPHTQCNLISYYVIWDIH